MGAGGKGKGKGKGKSKGNAAGAKKGKKGRGRGDTNGFYWRPKVAPGTTNTARRTSLFSKSPLQASFLSAVPGGKIAELHTRSEMLGVLECVLVEPVGKTLAPEEFTTTGVVICLHGMPLSQECMEEWGSALAAAQWVEVNSTVVIPNVQMSSALALEDFEAIIDASLELANFQSCLLVGKAWCAQRVVEVAAMGKLKGKVEGIVLVAPSHPAPDECADLVVPVMLVWARDDEVSPYEDYREWTKALDERPAPTTLLTAQKGGHRFDLMLESDRIAKGVHNFCVSAFLISDLEDGDDEDDAEEDEQSMRPRSLSMRSQRLSNALPEFVQEDLQDELEPSTADETDDGQGLSLKGKRSARRASLMQAGLVEEKTDDLSSAGKKSVRRFSLGLQSWMQNGMPTAAE